MNKSVVPTSDLSNRSLADQLELCPFIGARFRNKLFSKYKFDLNQS